MFRDDTTLVEAVFQERTDPGIQYRPSQPMTAFGDRQQGHRNSRTLQ